MMSDIEYRSHFLDEYKIFRDLRKTAEKEGAVETVKVIDEEIRYIKLKLQPLVVFID